MIKQQIQPAVSGLKKINEVRKPQKNSCTFDTKEEFIAHLIRIGEIQKSPHHLPNDGFICLQGVLKIDHRVKSGLNWSDVITTSAIVADGQISNYKYLPLTTKGITTNLKAPDLAQYMLHNNYGATCKNNQWYVNTLRIPESASHLDFSPVHARQTLFYGRQINLSQLPYSRMIFGLSPQYLGIDCPNARQIARNKGCGKDILKIMPSSGAWSGVIDVFSGIFAAARR